MGENEKLIRGVIHGVAGPTVVASGMAGVRMHTVCTVGKSGLLAEVIRIRDDYATLQVYEDTGGLSLGEDVVSYSKPLTVTLGPGLISNIFDGIQRPLTELSDFIDKGLQVVPLDMDRIWDFSPVKKKGDSLGPGDVLGVVPETERITHKIMVPPGLRGVIREIRSGSVTGREPVCILEDGSEVDLYQEWPVRVPRPYLEKLPLSEPFITGQRVFDTLLPVATGGTAIVPGGFGTGKTIVEQTIAKYGRSDVIVYIGCGERGNEMTEILTDFPRLKDPVTGLPLSSRTVIVVNTSNMPVAAREASIFTGVTIAEYFRDMGYDVALLADSISRWAEALREISSMLEEMPGEEGFPPYLATHLGSFYERSGKVRCLGDGAGGVQRTEQAVDEGGADEERREASTGSVTIISAVSPPGGDFSEPVTQSSLRFAGALWALDPELAYRRHFPAVNWQMSFSLYYPELAGWFEKVVSPDLGVLRGRLFKLLQKDKELQDVIQIIGVEALQETDRLTLEVATMAREVFLKQSVFNEADAFNSYEKQLWMLKALFAFFDCAGSALKRGVYIENIIETPLRARLLNMKDEKNEGFGDFARILVEEIEKRLSVEEAGTV